jgi:hypothetical protein
VWLKVKRFSVVVKVQQTGFGLSSMVMDGLMGVTLNWQGHATNTKELTSQILATNLVLCLVE